MRYRPFGGTGWDVSEVGYGMWGMAGWTGSDDEESLASLDRAIALGCNFFDTAWAYGDGHSERLLGRTLKRHPGTRLYIATKIPPKNRKWPALAELRARGRLSARLHPRIHRAQPARTSACRRSTCSSFTSGATRGPTTAAGSARPRQLKEDGLVRAIGISINRWQPANVLRALDTGLIDAVQVVYNVFDQSPEDELFPACRDKNIAVIARVPFDEGSLTGTLTADTRWPDGDFRNLYFRPENLIPTLERVDRLRPVVPPGMTMPELALRHILQHPDVSTVIPGMRKLKHVEANLGVSDGRALPGPLMDELAAAQVGQDGGLWSDIMTFSPKPEGARCEGRDSP